MILKIRELTEVDKKKPPGVAESRSDFIADKYILTDLEQNYVTKLVDILRGFNQQAKLAVKANIDALYHHKKER